MKTVPVKIYLPDQRDVTIDPHYGLGNAKIGFGVYTYSRIADYTDGGGEKGTCPGATQECEAICYAKRIDGAAKTMYQRNYGPDVPPIPLECQILRIHISGDFDSVDYVNNWIHRLTERADVTCWAYTRSWRVPELLPHLGKLRALANMQLFASMDPSLPDEQAPVGWRRAWIWRDWDNDLKWPVEARLKLPTCAVCGDTGEYEGEYGPRACMPCTVGNIRQRDQHNMTVRADGTPAYVCPEETGRRKDCLACGYCFEGTKHDVVFLEHHGQ